MFWPYGFPCWDCCSKYGLNADDIFCVSPNKIAKYYLQYVHYATVDTARMLAIELIFIRNGSFRVNLPCFEDDVRFLIYHLSSAFLFYFTFSLLRYFEYEFIIHTYIHRVITLQTLWNSLTIPWRFGALLTILTGTHTMPVLLVLKSMIKLSYAITMTP